MNAVDLLHADIERARPLLTDATSTKGRIRILWAAAMQARDLSTGDVIRDAFTQIAVEVGLIDSEGRWTRVDVNGRVRPFGAEDVAHTINWSLKGWNTFEKGPLK